VKKERQGACAWQPQRSALLVSDSGRKSENNGRNISREDIASQLVITQSTSNSELPSTMNGPLFGNTGGGSSGLGQMGDAQAVAAAKNVSPTVNQATRQSPEQRPSGTDMTWIQLII
jgi:hypothetical protein